MKIILLKVSGELFAKSNNIIDKQPAVNLIRQIKTLREQEYRFGIVIGGGNFFRGASEGNILGMQRSSADNIGMLATIMNGLILQDLFMQEGITSKVLSSLTIPGMAEHVTQATINKYLDQHHCVIFVGGTGCPYFSTDTNAVIRALQMSAHELWKATNVDGVYDDDPAYNKHAKPLETVTFNEVLTKKLRVMDMTAFSLARDHALPIRIFNVWHDEALLCAANNKNFGTIITL